MTESRSVPIMSAKVTAFIDLMRQQFERHLSRSDETGLVW